LTLSAALFTSDSQTWNTPACVLERVRLVDHIELDPCGNAGSIVGASREFLLDRDEDGLSLPWSSLTYCNPPYDDLESWAAKMAREAARGVEIIACIPARTDTSAFQARILSTCQAICFWRGRLRFGAGPADKQQTTMFGEAPSSQPTGDNTAPFPSALPYWGPRVERFAAAFGDVGRVVVTTLNTRAMR
jgi:hypothetical protein